MSEKVWDVKEDAETAASLRRLFDPERLVSLAAMRQPDFAAMLPCLSVSGADLAAFAAVGEMMTEALKALENTQALAADLAAIESIAIPRAFAGEALRRMVEPRDNRPTIQGPDVEM